MFAALRFIHFYP
jgi:hypothetical protein